MKSGRRLCFNKVTGVVCGLTIQIKGLSSTFTCGAVYYAVQGGSNFWVSA